MRRFGTYFGMFTLGLALLAAALNPAAADPFDGRPDREDTERYIVMLDDQSDPDEISLRQARRLGLQIGHAYRRAVNGFSARIAPSRVPELEADPAVAAVIPDGRIEGDAQVVPWGMATIAATRSSALVGNGSGTVSGVNAYVIDSGINSHPDLNVVQRLNFTEEKNTDCHGHGTHVAGTIAARDNGTGVVGVAPGLRVTSLKVLDCDNYGWYSDFVAAIDWITENADKPAVANMSIGGNPSDYVDGAIRRSVASGVLYTVSAGNKSTSACNQSPARAGGGSNNGIVTVAAIDAKSAEASFSNYGDCVDVWAPGVGIQSTRNDGVGVRTMSGTSMAAPHAAGGAALYLADNPKASPASVETALKKSADLISQLSEDGERIKRLDVGGF